MVMETFRGSQDVNGDGGGDRNESSSVNGNGDEDGNGDGNEDRIREGGGDAKKRKKNTRVVDEIRHFHSVRVIISVDRG